MDGAWETIPGVDHWPLHVCTHTCTDMHTHIRPYPQFGRKWGKTRLCPVQLWAQLCGALVLSLDLSQCVDLEICIFMVLFVCLGFYLYIFLDRVSLMSHLAWNLLCRPSWPWSCAGIKVCWSTKSSLSCCSLMIHYVENFKYKCRGVKVVFILLSPDSLMSNVGCHLSCTVFYLQTLKQISDFIPFMHLLYKKFF